VRWDAETRTLRDFPFGIGRRFTTSASNAVAASTDLTPDCAVQNSRDLGIVAEAKLGLPQNKDYWDGDILQLKKYDDDLTGWWTETEHVSQHDIVALVPWLRAVDFSEHIDDGVVNGKWSFERRPSVVGFQRLNGPEKTWVQVMRFGGAISDAHLDDRLRRVRQVNWEILLEKYGDRKFLDHPPPLPALLQIIWDDLFVEYADAVLRKSDVLPGQKFVEFTVTAAEIARDLQKYYGFTSSGARSPAIPKTSWVKDAMDALVEFKMARRTENGDFMVRYKRLRGDTMERFGRLCFRRKPKPQINDKQTRLKFE
jgi:hypothetical protein